MNASMNQKLILAGAGSLFGHEKILESFRALGFDPVFVEVPYIKKYMSQQNHDGTLDDRTILFTEELESREPAIVIPLSEYWISKCAQLELGKTSSEKNQCLISDVALKASRSKKFLYEVLKSAGFTVPKIFADAQEAREFISKDRSHRVVVKPEGLFSGYGVKVVGTENLGKLEQYEYNACNVHNNAIKLFRISSSNALITQALEGTEYSADVFFFRGKVSIVRVCRKVIVNIHDSPCTAICQLVESTTAMRQAIEGWCHAIFGGQDVTFGQFDFIDMNPKTEENSETEAAPDARAESRPADFAPIDFACRIGGGMAELLSEYERETDINVYARAVGESLFPQNSCNSACKKNPEELYWTQHNYLSTKSGTLKDEVENLSGGLVNGKAFIYKHKNDFVPECPSSAASRIAVVVNRTPLLHGKDGLLAAEKLLVGEDAVEFWKNSRGKRPAD